MSRSEAAAQEEPQRKGQKDAPGGELGRLELRGRWAWLRAPLRKGAIQAGLSPQPDKDVFLGLRCLPEGKKGLA